MVFSLPIKISSHGMALYLFVSDEKNHTFCSGGGRSVDNDCSAVVGDVMVVDRQNR